MPTGHIVAGYPIYAQDVLDELAAQAATTAANLALTTARVPIRARQTAQINRTNNTFVDLTGMSAPVAANKVYRLRGRAVCTGANTTHKVKFQFTLPSLATIDWSMYSGASSSTANPTTIDVGTTTGSHTRLSISGTLAYAFEGYITTGANAGTAQLQGGQSVTDAGTLSFLVGSGFSLEEWV